MVTIHGVCTVQNDVEEEQIAEEDSKLVYDRLIEEADDSGFKDKLTKLAKKVNPGTPSPCQQRSSSTSVLMRFRRLISEDLPMPRLMFLRDLPSLKTLPAFEP